MPLIQVTLYINFHNVEPSMWGWNGKTFGD